MLGVLEVLDHSGKVGVQIRMTESPLTIGRAYDNDLIIDDPYICPHHTRIFLSDSGQLFAEDLNSLNGLFLDGNQDRVKRILLSPTARLRIGHTTLRYRNLDYEVEKTLPSHHARRFRGVFENRLAQILIFAATLSALGANSFFETVERRDAPEPAFDLALPVFFIILWAGIWTFAGRVITHRVKFLTHCTVISLALLTLFVVDTSLEYLAFALSLDHIRSMLNVWVGVTILGMALYSHLCFATEASQIRLGIVASAISVSVIGLLSLKFHVDSAEFNVAPSLNATLKAPVFQLAQEESPEDFFSRLSQLRDDVVSQTKNQPP